MRFRSVVLLLLLPVLPLQGFSCVNFRYFSVRPHVADASAGTLTIASLAAEYDLVLESAREWAAAVGAAEETCGVYTDDNKPLNSPACALFRGRDYSVSVEFAPVANATGVNITSFDSGTSDRVWNDLKKHFRARFGRDAVTDGSGGQNPVD